GWIERRPDVIRDLLSEMARLGDAGEAELARLARSAAVPLATRFAAMALSGGQSSAELRDELRRLLDGAYHELRERAATRLLAIANADDRRLVLEKFLAGAFRETFEVTLAHEDLGFLQAQARTATGEARLRLARLLERFADGARVPLLIDLWRTGDAELKA